VTPRGSLIGGALSALSGIRSSMISPRLGSTVNITPIPQEQFHTSNDAHPQQHHTNNHHHHHHHHQNDLEQGHAGV
jgi:ABC-type Zn2+ transport system substrate-binding protein/surface adhesin